MILKSFLRKKQTKILMFIITMLFFSITVMFGLVNSLERKEEEIKYKTSFVYVESNNNDVFKYKDFVNQRECLLVNSISIDAKSLYISEFKDKILVFKDGKLKEGEVVIRLLYNDYLKNRDYINKGVNIVFNGQNINLMVKGIISDNYRSEIYISDNLFRELQRNDDIRKYIVNVSDYNKEVEIISDYVKNSSNNML